MAGIAQQLFADKTIRYLLYFPKPLDSSHPSYTIRERLLNLRHAIGCSYRELGFMLAVIEDWITYLCSNPSPRCIASHDFERKLRKLEALFAEEIAHYLRDPRRRDRYYCRYKPTPIRLTYGGYRLSFHAQRYRGFTIRPYKLSDIQKVEDLEALRGAKRTKWKTSTPTERRLRRLDSLAVSEAACGGFDEVIESGSYHIEDCEVELGQPVHADV